ncbi:MAG: DUF3887 domain-containing protein [Candidatus Omnitrophica bacterium]|nr:DUF3887 domain-containing protein [Candidatus Omnitrophota bacterium]MBU4479565.1 DUF3887 domain-containing protein [Candidatus Omnitrophota bacterium]MCG2704426.1 DUF3887 domain-containing protein [Candidatus Omnitrophota bacterium]
MKKILCFFLCFMFLAASPQSVNAAVIGQSNEQVRAITDPIMDNIFDGLNNEDYDKYSRDFDGTLKETLSPERFRAVRKEIKDWVGNYLYREYLGFINRQAITIIFWKAVFDKTQDEILIKLVVSERDGKYLVTGLWFQ